MQSAISCLAIGPTATAPPFCINFISWATKSFWAFRITSFSSSWDACWEGFVTLLEDDVKLLRTESSLWSQSKRKLGLSGSSRLLNLASSSNKLWASMILFSNDSNGGVSKIKHNQISFFKTSNQKQLSEIMYCLLIIRSVCQIEFYVVSVTVKPKFLNIDGNFDRFPK